MTFALMIFVAGLLYGISAFCGSRVGGGDSSLRIGIAGFAMQTLALAYFGAVYGRFPTATVYELLEVLVWSFALIHIAFAIFLQKRFTGVFSMLPACVLSLLPLGCPVFLKSVMGAAAPVSPVAGLHALLALVSYSFVAAAACFGILYLLQRRSLRNKSHGFFGRLSPSLQTLEKWTTMCIGASALAMFAAFATGFYAVFFISVDLTVTAAAHLKFVAASLLFGAQCAVAGLCVFGKTGGAKLAWLSILLAIMAIAAFVPVEIFSITK